MISFEAFVDEMVKISAIYGRSPATWEILSKFRQGAGQKRHLVPRGPGGKRTGVAVFAPERDIGMVERARRQWLKATPGATRDDWQRYISTQGGTGR